MEAFFTVYTRIDYNLMKKIYRRKLFPRRMIYAVIMLGLLIYCLVIQINALSHGVSPYEIHWSWYFYDIAIPAILIYYFCIQDIVLAKKDSKQCMAIFQCPYREYHRFIFDDHIQELEPATNAVLTYRYSDLKRIRRAGNYLELHFPAVSLTLDLRNINGGTAEELIAFLESKKPAKA